MKPHIFSNTATCAPCRFLVQRLDSSHPGWEDKVEYVDMAKGITGSQNEVRMKHKLRLVPSMVDDDVGVLVGVQAIVDRVSKLP